MARATGLAVLCCALSSCRAFHTPITTRLISSRRDASSVQQCRSSRRRSHISVSMKEEVTAAEAVVVSEATADAVVVKGESATASEAGRTITKKNRQDIYKNQPKPQPKKEWTPEEQKYLDKMASAPIIYKRIPEQEFYPSVGYESSYPTLKESRKKNYTGVSTTVGPYGKVQTLMRVVVFGGGEQEGEFLKILSEKGAAKLVDGLYALWDPREGELSETVASVNRINVHDLGNVKIRNPQEVAKHARFLAANMLVAVRKHPSYGDDFVPRLKKAALDNGLTFVGPDLAAEVAKGEMEGFTKLVQATRKALEEE